MLQRSQVCNLTRGQKMSENSGKTEFPLRPFTFFHRAMLISVDTQFSTHTDIKIDGETLAGYMQITVCIMHQNLPGSVIQERTSALTEGWNEIPVNPVELSQFWVIFG